MDKMEEYLKWLHPTKEYAIDELEKRLSNSKYVVFILNKNPNYYHSNGIEAERENQKIINEGIKRLENGEDPEEVMSKYHDHSHQKTFEA